MFNESDFAIMGFFMWVGAIMCFSAFIGALGFVGWLIIEGFKAIFNGWL